MKSKYQGLGSDIKEGTTSFAKQSNFLNNINNLEMSLTEGGGVNPVNGVAVYGKPMP
mgnify:CR=1 FL=1